jgi:mannose-6-phosphate isomerase-like protein (cupin superfamily)
MYIPGEGFHPILIRKGWQVAQLNYIAPQGFQAITRMEIHRRTDEVFMLLKGTAILIAGELGKGGFVFDCLRMKRGLTYNIPVDTWHNIAMDESAQVIIVEIDDTHLTDVTYRGLSQEEKASLYKAIENIK